MDRKALAATAERIVSDHRGILAADESTSTITKRFQKLGVPSTEETRRDYRAAMFSAKGLERHIGGVILYDETLRQKTSDGVPIPELLRSRGIEPGIKVDTGAHDLAGFPGEKITEGLDGLRGRLAEYAKMGATFCKWRAVITIGEGIPSDGCLTANAHALARYAALCQEAGLVPIVEPEVLMDGDHGIEDCEAATGRTWEKVFHHLHKQRVALEGILLKPSMVIAGKDGPRVPRKEVATRTVALLRRHVPAAVPAIVFLSGGQTPVEATEHLALMNQLGPQPWKLSFSYGRALQDPPMAAYAKDMRDVAAVQRAILTRAQANSAACAGKTEAAVAV